MSHSSKEDAFGESEFDPDREYNVFVPEQEKNEFLFAKYGTKNSKAFKDSGGIILSPSGVSKFFNNSKEWYEDRTGIPVFGGNTATVLGNAVHAYIESILRKAKPVTSDDVSFWLGQNYGMNPDVDRAEVLKFFPEMARAWKQEYDGGKHRTPTYVEVEMEHVEIEEDDISIGVFGTADAVYGDILVDWKTCASKPKGIGNYKYQLMQYVRVLRKKGITINKIKIVYIQRPTKTIGARVWTFEHKVTPADLIQADWFAELQINTLLLVNNNPGIKDLVFRENPISMW